MAVTDQQLLEITTFAGAYMAKEEIAIICDLDDCATGDLSDGETAAGKAFLKGRLLRKAQFNTSICKLSDQLSSPAQAIELKLSKDTFLNDKKR